MKHDGLKGQHIVERWGFHIHITGAGARLLEDTPELSPDVVRQTRADAILKRSRTSTIHAFTLPSGEEIYYKFDNTRGAVDFLKNLLRPSRALRAWRALGRLKRRGFLVPSLVACGEKRCGPVLIESFLVTRRIRGGVPLNAAGWKDDPARKKRLVTCVATLVRRLHQSGVYHADLNPANILVGPDGEELHLLDVDRTVFSARVSWRKKKKNVSQLDASLGEDLTLRDRVRFYRSYDPAFSAYTRRRRRRILREIEAMARRRWRV